MSYTLNPNLPRVRMQAVKLIKLGWSTRQVARYLGFNQSTIVKWKKKDPLDGRLVIPTRSSRPKSHPCRLSSEIIKKIIETRVRYNRCSEVVHQELVNQGIKVSLSSVKRTLDRNYLTKKRSPWKRQHFNQPRPSPIKPGDLVQIDTIHLMKNQSQRIYIYTLIDVYSRWAYAKASENISAGNTVKFIDQAKKRLPFNLSCLQSDNGSEFSQYFTERVKILHRHSRVRKPNDNAHLERFNRTIQEELLDRLPRSVKTINQVLPRYLKYYNEQRLHLGLNLKTPLQVMPRY